MIETQQRCEDEYIFIKSTWISEENRRKVTFSCIIAVAFLCLIAAHPNPNRSGGEYRPQQQYNTQEIQAAVTYGVTADGLRFRSNQPELLYSGIYYRPGELESNPAILTTYANWWMNGEYLASDTQGCFGDPVDGTQFQVATWFYPCGSELVILNPRTGKSVRVFVTDRGPNRYWKGAGYDNDRIYGFAIDITPAVGAAIGQQPNDAVVVIPLRLSGAFQAELGPALDLTQGNS